jgi:hypothetical protein
MPITYVVRQLRLSNLSFFHEIDQAAAAGNERGININRPIMYHWFGQSLVDGRATAGENFVVQDHWLDGSNTQLVSEKSRDINLQGGGKNWRLEGGMVRGSHYRSIREDDYMVMCFNPNTSSLGWVIVRGRGGQPIALGPRSVPFGELAIHDGITALIGSSSAHAGARSMWIIDDSAGRPLWQAVGAQYTAANQIHAEVSAGSFEAQSGILIQQAAGGVMPSSTTYKALVDARRGQGRYRQSLINRWSTCALTGLGHPQLLRASHLKPWRDSNNFERLLVDNGLLLAASVDAALDEGLIAFQDDGRLLISSHMSATDVRILSLDSYTQLRLCPTSLSPFLKIHRETRFLGP